MTKYKNKFLIQHLSYICCLFIMTSAGLYSESSRITEIKAFFVYTFTKYIEWPESMKQKDFKICVFGDSKLEGPLRQIADTKKIQDRNISLSIVKSVQDINNCNILIIDSENIDSLDAVRKHLKNKPVLTITDVEDSNSYDVCLNFVVKNNKVRFEVNIESLNKTDLKVSSQLLKLAIIK